MAATLTPALIVEKMIENDAFSKWMGIELIDITAETCVLAMSVRADMLNGFGILHGGVSFAFADSAFAFLCNALGLHAVSLESSISHVKAVKNGAVLRAVATCTHRSRKVGVYQVRILDETDTLVADFKGTCFVKDTAWS